jgi:hypothetical protein
LTGPKSVCYGDAVNIAARFGAGRAAGDVLGGAPTLDFVRAAVEVEPGEALALEGKAERGFHLSSPRFLPGRLSIAPLRVSKTKKPAPWAE